MEVEGGWLELRADPRRPSSSSVQPWPCSVGTDQRMDCSQQGPWGGSVSPRPEAVCTLTDLLSPAAPRGGSLLEACRLAFGRFTQGPGAQELAKGKE